MTLEEMTERLSQQAAKVDPMGKSLKFAFDEGVVHVDMTGEQTVVTNEDKEADCVITTSLDTLHKVSRGELNAMMAVMSGKVKIRGDMGLAMSLTSLIGG